MPVGYLKQEVKRPIPLSRLHVEPADYGIAGAEMALKDNNTTGRFTKQEFTLDVERVAVGGDALAALQARRQRTSLHPRRCAGGDASCAFRRGQGKDVLLFNVRAEDEELRAGTNAAPTFCTRRRTATCSPMRSRNISCGRNGSAGSW